MMKHLLLSTFITLLLAFGQTVNTEADSGGDAATELFLVKDNRPRAAIVVADKPALVAHYAAKELATHVELATGVALDIVHESDAHEHNSRIFVGVTAATESLGLDIDVMEHDEFVLRTKGNDLYIVGKEDPTRTSLMDGPEERRVLDGGYYASFDKSSPNGTLFGVYELLDRHLGVRWLWPGEHGTYVPKYETVAIRGPLDELHKPKIGFRQYGWDRIARAGRRAEEGADDAPPGRLWRLARNISEELIPQVEGLTFSAPVMEAYYRDTGVYLARHRLGRSEPRPRIRHTFHSWWRKYGKDHPEWFMMREDGERGPLNGEIAAMCVSNPDLHHFIVEEYWDGGDYLPLGEVDGRVACQCESCLAWDEPQPKDYPDFARRDYEPQMLSNRYARFWKLIQEMAAERNPDVTVTSYVYVNYFPAPSSDIQLNSNIYVEFVPWTGKNVTYPQPDEVDRWVRQQWKGWVDRGVRIGYRPNNLLAGYVMPHFSTWQAGDFFQFAYRNGMTGFAFDRLVGNWATKGLMLYMYMRLAWHPDADIADIRQEYFSAFGPAAPHVEAYFDYWEQYNTQRGGGTLLSPVNAHGAYPDEALAEGERILNNALEAAQQHDLPEYAKRVAYLQLGLEHAKLAAQLMATLDGGRAPVNEPARFVKAQEALSTLMDFRSEHEHLYIAELFDAANRETRWVDLPTLLHDAEDVAAEQVPGLVPDPWETWLFRADPANRGMRDKWYQALAEDGNWRPIDVPARWSESHVGDYLGYGWYRTTFTIPAEKQGQNLRLLFQGVDEEAWVFVNGSQVGEHSEASEQRPVSELWSAPFNVDVAPEHLRFGEENVLMVRVRASAGQAGIWRSVLMQFSNRR